MLNEDSATGFFAKMRSAFSYSEKSTQPEKETDNVAVAELAVEPEYTEAFSETSYSAPTSNLSVTEKEISVRTVHVTAPTFPLPDKKDLDIQFATRFISAGGKFIFCENMKQAVENLRLLKEDHSWRHVFCWENEIKDAFCESNFQKGAIGFTIENSDAAISLCESLIAEDGTIVLNPKQASRRRLPCFPRTHIIITDAAHLVANELEGLRRFSSHNKGELPSVIKLGSCNNGHFYDKQRLILNAEGTEDIYVFFVDELIPPSLRP